MKLTSLLAFLLMAALSFAVACGYRKVAAWLDPPPPPKPRTMSVGRTFVELKDLRRIGELRTARINRFERVEHRVESPGTLGNYYKEGTWVVRVVIDVGADLSDIDDFSEPPRVRILEVTPLWQSEKGTVVWETRDNGARLREVNLTAVVMQKAEAQARKSVLASSDLDLAQERMNTVWAALQRHLPQPADAPVGEYADER